MAASTDAPERWYLALLGFAEHFRTSSPAKIRLCVHCLQAVFRFKPPPRIEARTHLQLGSVLYRQTKNSKLAQTNLEKAISQFEDVKFEAASILSEFYCQQVAAADGEETERSAPSADTVRDYCREMAGKPHSEGLEFSSWCCRDAGQVKSVKPCLKQLQQCIQTISTLHDDDILPTNPAAIFHWLPKEHMCVLVYLVTVMHSMQAGYLEKAKKYTDKALMQLEKLKMLDNSPILSTFQVILLEHIIMCRLVTGHKATALQEVSQQLFLSFASSLPDCLQIMLLSFIHYWDSTVFSVNCMDNAEAQFTAALQMTTHQELWTFIVTNLASVYIREGNRHQEESNNMVVPAMQLASKIPDMSVQLWSSALLKDLNKACGNTMDAHEAAQMHQNFSQQLLQDHIAACSLPEHDVISWTDGLPPVQFQPQNGPTTSLTSLL
ncbi:hypothetical protein PAMA_005127 [Pampus argenteus]